MDAQLRRRTRLRDNRGYSLVELMTALGIFGVLAASGLPHIDTRRQDINSLKTEVIADLRFARSRAITTGTHFDFVLAEDGKSYEINRLIEGVDEDGDRTWDFDSLAKTVVLPPHLQLTMPSEVETIEFNTRGMMVSAEELFAIAIADNLHGAAHTLTVWPSGQISDEE